MAKQEHVDILKHGVDEWNTWREQNPEIQPDFRGANLRGGQFSHADLTDAVLTFADLSRANLSEAKLNRADLTHTNLFYTNLQGANLSTTNLADANFNATNMGGATLTNAIADRTTFGGLDLRTVQGLETIKHRGPSNLSINTIYLSQGQIPEAFLRGTGAPDGFIEYMHSLVNQPIQYYTCFVSYSSKDSEFVDRLYTDLQQNNVRCWLDREDLKIGDKFRNSINEAIRIHDKLLLVLSEHSIESDWVETEVETAFEKEHKQKKLVLFPVTLDDTIMNTEQAWAGTIKRMRHIGDFKHWKEHDSYQKTLKRLLRDLKAPDTAKQERGYPQVLEQLPAVDGVVGQD